MRPIDADELMEEIAGMSIVITGLRIGNGVLTEFAQEYRKSVLRIIDEAPTIGYKDLVPQGEWVNNADDYPECNRCGYMPAYDPAIDDIAYSNFCPHCGARMKGND